LGFSQRGVNLSFSFSFQGIDFNDSVEGAKNESLARVEISLDQLMRKNDFFHWVRFSPQKGNVFVKISLENLDSEKNRREEILRELFHLKTPQRVGEKSFLQEIFEEFPEIDPNSQVRSLSVLLFTFLDFSP
jgi:hypothetical protein